MCSLGALFLTLFVVKVSANYYCEFGICDENSEYCCGESKCCKKTVEVWYYWAVVFLVIITIIIAAFFYLKWLNSKKKIYNELKRPLTPVCS